MNKFTRFRAYQLGTKGSSFSYAVDDTFTLIEARYNETNKPNIAYEMKKAGCDRITTLHITSWDNDHCNPNELEAILKELRPFNIEYPWYEPDTDSGKQSLSLIKNYIKATSSSGIPVSPAFINGLEAGTPQKYTAILYNPKKNASTHNDNSIVKLFRLGRFTVLSLGDCESAEIANDIMGCSIAKSETDVMILAHHGADNGFTTDEFIKAIKPKVAVCSSNYDNEYEHPRPAIREKFHKLNIPLYTTKTGDILVTCGEDNQAMVYNFIAGNEVLNSKKSFTPKLLVE